MGRQPANAVPVAEAVKNTGRIMPNRLYVRAPGYNARQCELLANRSVAAVRAVTPKLSGRGAAGIKPYFGDGWFGIRWDRPYLWQQNAGTAPHTMKNLAGKVIPMWIDDPTGAEARANPKAKKRRTINGRQQILIFRKAAKPGARKRVAVRDGSGRLVRWRDVPASYPGAPGRINRRSYNERLGTSSGKIAKLVPRPHVGVRWRHPGIVSREFMQHGLMQVAQTARIPDPTIFRHVPEALMFVANTLTVWVEAFRNVFHSTDYTGESLRDIPIHTNYPMAEVDYPGLWVNYSMQGDLKNVGIGHKEYVVDDDGNTHEVGRWHFGGLVEVTIGAMTNLERALLLDEFTKTIAIGRVDVNHEGELRRHIERSDLIGQIVTWDSFAVGAFAESQGTPWGTDDVIYEATVSLTTSGEVIVDPNTGALVRLSSVITDVVVEAEAVLPTPGTDGWL